jgi:hypothetical protein
MQYKVLKKKALFGIKNGLQEILFDVYLTKQPISTHNSLIINDFLFGAYLIDASIFKKKSNFAA